MPFYNIRQLQDADSRLLKSTDSGIQDVLKSFDGLQEVTIPATSMFKVNDEIVAENAPTKPVMVVDVPGLERPYKVDIHGYSKIMRMVGFSEKVVDEYPFRMMMEPLNYGFKERIGDSVKAFIKQDHVVAFVKPNVELVSVREMVDRANNKFGDDNLLIQRMDQNLRNTNISMITSNKDRGWWDDRIKDLVVPGTHNKVNDVVLGGINISGSLVGEAPWEVSGYLYRLICTNGMIAADSIFKWSRKNTMGDDNSPTKNFMEWFDEVVDASLLGIDHEFEKIDQMTRTPVPERDRAKVLTNVFKEYEISQRARKAITDRMIDNPPRHMFDIINAVTNVANDEETPQGVRRLQRVGGQIATSAHICETCHTVLKA